MPEGDGGQQQQQQGAGAQGGGAGDGGAGAGGGGGQGGTGGEPAHGHRVDEDRIVDRVVDKVRGLFGSLIGDGAIGVGEGEGAGGDGTTGGQQPPTPHPTGQQVEDDMEQRVRAIVGQLHDEHDHDDQHRRVAEMLERVPARLTRRARFMFGAEKEGEQHRPRQRAAQ